MFLLCLYFPLLETFSEVSLTGLFLWLTADLGAMESVVMICLDFKGNMAIPLFWVKSFTSDSVPHWCKVSFSPFRLLFIWSHVYSAFGWLGAGKMPSCKGDVILVIAATIVAHRVTITLYCCHWSSSDTPTPPKLVLHEQCLSSQSLGRCSLKFCQGPCGYKAVMCCSFTV